MTNMEAEPLSPRMARGRRKRRRTTLNQIDAGEARLLVGLLVGATRRVVSSRAVVATRLRGFFDSLVEAHEALDRPIEIDADAFDRLTLAERRASLEALCSSLGRARQHRHTGFDKRVGWLADLVGLSKAEAEIYAIIARYQLRPEFRVLSSILHVSQQHRSDGIDPFAISLLTGVGVPTVRRVLDPGGRLVQLGLLIERDPYEFDLDDRLKRFLQTNVASASRMRSTLLSVAPRSTLKLHDFAHLGSSVANALELVRHSANSGHRANILLYGIPGAGKTELARFLADQAGLEAIEVGNADEDGDEPSRRDRLLHLRLCRGLCGPSQPAVLLIDEAEDLFSPQAMETASKLWLNRLVESGRGPHIWIANRLGELGEPVVRRMDLAIRFTTPPAHVQTRIARRATMLRGKPASFETVELLAALKTSPAILATAVRTSRRVGGGEQDLLRISRELARATGRYSDGPPITVEAFDPALSRTDHNLEMLSQRLATTEAPWTLLLHGAPGTGKSAFARHLAKASGRELIIKAASDLLGCFVGQTEQAIAAAFEEAEEARGILLFDEADEFLSDRSRARAQWEASMVNEMLRQMERCRTRFIATTNRSEVFDPATARRFSLAVEFRPMDAQQARGMFRATFGIDAPACLDQIAGLTPGDFAQAKQRASLLGEASPAIFLRWLTEAVAGRHVTGPIGF